MNTRLMKALLLALKAGLIAVYALGLSQLVEPGGFGIPFWMLWVAMGLWVVHLGEFLLLLPRLKSLAGSLPHHFCHTLMFGFLHWLPLLRHQTPPAL